MAWQGFACQGFLKGGVSARAHPIGPGTFTALHRSILLVSQRVGGGVRFGHWRALDTQVLLGVGRLRRPLPAGGLALRSPSD